MINKISVFKDIRLMNTPIIITAFGTTSTALNTYSYMDKRLKKYLPDNEIIWSYSSRMVKDWIKKRHNIEMKHPHQVLNELKEKGHSWAVVQSLHLICGHEFYRLAREINIPGIRTSMGLPLLTDPGDYEVVAHGIKTAYQTANDEALVLVGHGTDHPGWASYTTLLHISREKFGKKIFMGAIEEGYLSQEKTIEDVKKAGFRKVRIIPFMIVAGVHFHEDLTGDDDSWKTGFEEEGFSVTVEPSGLGFNHGIIEIYCKHIQDALDIIPDSSPIRKAD